MTSIQKNANNIDKYFEDEEIIIETKQEIDVMEQVIDDDKVYEMDVYNSLIQNLPIDKQNNRRYQNKYLAYAKQIVDLKNKAKHDLQKGIDIYDGMEDVLDFNFNLNWIIPVVLDKQKIYKKLEIGGDTSNDDVLEKYINAASDKGIEFEDFFTEINKEQKLEDEYNKDTITLKKYIKKLFDLRRPFLIKTDLNKKDVGYHFYLKEYTNLLRYFNIDNKYWKEHIGSGPLDTYYDILDEDDNYIRTAKNTLVNGDLVNLVGFYVIGPNRTNIMETLKGYEPYFDRLQVVGKIENIEKNIEAIVTVKNHGLKDGDNIMIRNSNSEPSIDGSYTRQIKVINNDKFTVPINTSDGKEGNQGDLIASSKLQFNKISLKKSDITDTKTDFPFEETTLYLFPEEEISKEFYVNIVKKVMPNISKILHSLKTKLNKCKTIIHFNEVVERFRFNFNDLCVKDFDNIVQTLESEYDNTIKDATKFNKNKFYNDIILLREKLSHEKTLQDITNNPIYGDKMILDKRIQKYYGQYPNYHKDVDSVLSRMNWVNSSPDSGKLFYLIVEEDRIKELSNSSLSVKEINDLIAILEKELKTIDTDYKISNIDKSCEQRTEKFKPVKVYSSFDTDGDSNRLFKDNLKVDEFLVGDFALIENKSNPHENGSIFQWDGNHWVINNIIQNIDDLCLLGENDFKKFDIESLLCLYKESCQSKKRIRLELRIEKLQEDIKNYKTISNDLKENLNTIIKDNLNIAEINLQIYVRDHIIKKSEEVEVVDENIDELMKKILSIKDTESRDYLTFLLIKKDGILIDRNIYSISSGKLICCGHYLYLMRINEANDPYFASKQIDEMITKYGNDEDGTIFCTNDGKPLDFVEYDENEGLSKLTGERKVQRNAWKTEVEILKESISQSIQEEKEIVVFECNDPSLRSELLKRGFKPEQIAKAKDICIKLNSLNGQTGINLAKKNIFLQ